MPVFNLIFNKIIATKVTRNMTTRLPSMVTITIFDAWGRQQMILNLPGELFPDNLLEGEELGFCKLVSKEVVQIVTGPKSA